MFKFNLNKNVDTSFVEANYFYAIYQINEYIEIELSKKILKLEFCIESKIDFKTSIFNQTILFLKDNFLSF